MFAKVLQAKPGQFSAHAHLVAKRPTLLIRNYHLSQPHVRPRIYPRPLHVQNQTRSFGLSSITRIAFKVLRVPVVVAGTAAASVTVANNTLQDWTETGTSFMKDGLKNAQDMLVKVQEQAEKFDMSIPEVRLRVPGAITELLASINSKVKEKPTTHTFLDHQTDEKESLKITESKEKDKNYQSSDGGDGGDPLPAAVIVATATINSDSPPEKTKEEEEEEEEEKKLAKKIKAKRESSMASHDEQLVMLTKKLIEIRTILMSIDQNDTLKLPSIVVIGSQSSGKSSVLEAIVGHEFLPKGADMVTRRPIELTLIHTPGVKEEYGEFPQLGLGKIRDFKEIQKTLVDLNRSVPDFMCVSDEPIELRVYSPHVPDLTLIDLPGYIQTTSNNQPESLKTKIEELCFSYIREPNIILAVCAANVDLANSPALRASRKADPLGLRTIGVVTKLDLVAPEVGTAILRNADYPLHLGYIGVVCKAPKHTEGNMTGALIRNEEAFFRHHLMYNQRDIHVGTSTLRFKLMSVLEQSMGKSLYSIVDAVQRELEEARYQFKVQYNDRRVTAESYVAETMDALKHNFKDFASHFGKPQVRHEVRSMLEQRILDICAEQYWSDPKIAELPKATTDDIYWLYKIDLASAALTKSGIGRSTTQLVVDILMKNMERLANSEPFTLHPTTRTQIMNFTSEVLRSRFLTTSDQVENTIKPYKYEVEVTDSEWADGVKRSIALLEREIEMCDKMAANIRSTIGKKKLKSAINYVLENERRQDQEKRLSETSGLSIVEEESDPDAPAIRPLYNPRLVEKAKEALFLRDRAMILKYRLAALKSRQCKSVDNKEYCPEAFLNVIAEKLTYTAVMFIQVELLNEFFFQFPREVDDRLVYQMNRKQILEFARENPPIRKHLELQERKMKLEEVMEKLNYLMRRQADRQAKPKQGSQVP